MSQHRDLTTDSVTSDNKFVCQNIQPYYVIAGPHYNDSALRNRTTCRPPEKLSRVITQMSGGSPVGIGPARLLYWLERSREPVRKLCFRIVGVPQHLPNCFAVQLSLADGSTRRDNADSGSLPDRKHRAGGRLYQSLLRHRCSHASHRAGWRHHRHPWWRAADTGVAHHHRRWLKALYSRLHRTGSDRTGHE